LGDGFGCVLTLMTAGLFLIVWGPLILVQGLTRARCQVCGRKN
jgi:hypothetical protein